ncbi:helix-turn-helix domain-containing protein [Mycobacterium colombiense]
MHAGGEPASPIAGAVGVSRATLYRALAEAGSS